MVLMSISICALSTNMILNGLTNRERERGGETLAGLREVPKRAMPDTTPLT